METNKQLNLEDIEKEHAARMAEANMMGMILQIMEKNEIPQEVKPNDSILEDDTTFNMIALLNEKDKKDRVKTIMDTILMSVTIPELMIIQEMCSYYTKKILYYEKPKEDEEGNNSSL